ncbi:endonuclease YncB(thermonuclease family) [Sphingomonas kaistensis]|uniref:Endonuclease YncB(Thermonuclease family) n=1 Tax=Sphingomonas kaistensis TaxID=298708 RepID=A0A7X5Y781_9SPHN|nr:thermonuclease family protein [Sphingomonas kaistensis]NJC06494.1 endonuclease YncB(thermonuclease family) [Sphingomonas kaistensis]
MLCLAATVIDGDGFRCRNLGEVRLLGIDAPDYQRSRPCRQGFGDHVCSDHQARAAKEAMQSALRLGPVRVETVGRDRYGRRLGMAYAGGVNLNCRMLRVSGVRYIARYDNGRRVRRACGL